MEKCVVNLEEGLDHVNFQLDWIQLVLERLMLRFPPTIKNGDRSAMGETSGEVGDRVDGKIQPRYAQINFSHFDGSEPLKFIS